MEIERLGVGAVTELLLFRECFETALLEQNLP
jgi:hypothetical protein